MVAFAIHWHESAMVYMYLTILNSPPTSLPIPTLTEWSKPERETLIQYINSYIWNLERWKWWPYMQDSKRDTDVKNTHLDYVGEGEGGMIWKNGIETCILSLHLWSISMQKKYLGLTICVWILFLSFFHLLFVSHLEH